MYTWFLDCIGDGVGTLNLCIVQGSTLYCFFLLPLLMYPLGNLESVSVEMKLLHGEY